MIPTTLPEALDRAIKDYPTHGVGFIHNDKSVRWLTYSELREEALGILSGFRNRGIATGEIVILSLDTCEEIVPILWACILGGIVPAMLQPPVSFSDYNPAAEKAGKVYKILDSPRIILSHSHMEIWRSSGISEDKLIDINEIPHANGDPQIATPKPDDLVVIQFSSGSTGDPKGIMLSHRNVLTNIYDIIKGSELVPEDITINWMPLYHDMGLFGFHITPVVCRFSHYLMDPADFVKNPFLWLDSLDEKNCTVTACPNFGEMVVNRYLSRRTVKNWDLSKIRVLFNGAEPISVPVMNEFTEALKLFGLRPESMFPCYGMAEATLAITFGPVLRGAEVMNFRREPILKKGIAVPAEAGETDVMELVNLGKALDNCRLKIADSKGNPLEENKVGNIYLKGGNVTRGYFNNPETTRKTFRDGWLYTGDLGFMYHGNLFVTGRIKDIIFINGINYYAHDLEIIALQVNGISAGKIVMSGYFDEKEGRDKVVVFMVGANTPAVHETFQQIRDLFLQKAGLSIDTFIPIRSGDIPRTSSGKIQRYKLVNRFLRNEFPVILNL
ncbi:MAG: AMP-binding protein [Bacteroidota bacterium]|nr:AMP-binding protein [Bacteroidota bacterium]